MDDQALKDRIRERLKKLKLSPITAATRGGLERSYIRDFLDGRKESVKTANFAKIAKGLGWTVGELLATQPINMSASRLTPDPAVDVPEIDVHAGANYAGGYTDEERTVDEHGNSVAADGVRATWGIPAPFLRGGLNVRPGRVHILPVKGDSMTETLFDGDRVMVDLDDTDVSQGGIFALVDDVGSLIIKQVELIREPGAKRILCTSRNERYQPFPLELAEPVKIIGRVACRITRL